MSRNCLLLLRLTIGVVAVWSASIVFAGELPRERIVYTTLRPANWELYFFEPNAPPKQITDDPAVDYDATFSPDGRWIVFCSERSGNLDLYAIDLTRPGPPKPLTRGPFMEAALWGTLEESRK